MVDYIGVGSSASSGKGTDTKSWIQPTTNRNIQVAKSKNNSNSNSTVSDAEEKEILAAMSNAKNTVAPQPRMDYMGQSTSVPATYNSTDEEKSLGLGVMDVAKLFLNPTGGMIDLLVKQFTSKGEEYDTPKPSPAMVDDYKQKLEAYVSSGRSSYTDPTNKAAIAAAAAESSNGGSSNGNTTTSGGSSVSAVDALSQARAPRGMLFEDLLGSATFNPETGQIDRTQAPEYQQFQQGLLQQLQGAQQAYQSFDPNDAASEYLRGVNAIREPMRDQQTDSKLSQLIRDGKLGTTVGAQALAQLEAAQENERFSEATQAMKLGTDMQDRMLANQAGMFGLTSQVADQQFNDYQQSLAAVPMLQEIYGFAQEPQFQYDLAKMGINAQRDANNATNMWGIIGDVAQTDFGQDAIKTVWETITGSKTA